MKKLEMVLVVIGPTAHILKNILEYNCIRVGNGISQQKSNRQARRVI
jgi:hypothetical protein